MNEKITQLPHWCITDLQPAFYDTESATVIEQTGVLYGKVRELVDTYNKFVDAINVHITEYESGVNTSIEVFTTGIRQEFQDFIDIVDLKVKDQEKVVLDAVDFMKTNLSDSITQIIHEMSESGELDTAVLDAINNIGERVVDLEDTSTIHTNNINTMKSLVLKNGDVVKTLGYYEINDGGSGVYHIREKQLDDIEDGGLIHFINDELVAEMIVENKTIIPEQFGCYGNGENDDTDNLQKTIDIAIENELKINFIGEYNVNPKIMSDNTKVCLTFARQGTMQSYPLEFNFIGNSCIKTKSNEECTLLRLNISNCKFTGLFLHGVEGKTNLLETSRINQLDQNEKTMNNRNSFINTKLMNGKDAISMQGGSYYNTFSKTTIDHCNRAVILGMETLEKNGTIQSNACNRNEFVGLTLLNITSDGIRVEYGDTNKFINTTFEGVNNPIYVDDPMLHKSDFAIEPKYYSYDNMFINITYEATSGIKFYNNIGGTKVININTSFIKDNFIVKPQVYIGGVNEGNSIEKVLSFYKNLENSRIYDSAVKYSTLCESTNGLNAKNFYDYIVKGDDIKPAIRTNTEWLIKNDSNVNNVTYDTSDKLFVKSLGGLIFLTSKLKVNVTDTSNAIKLYFPEDLSWLNHLNQMGKHNSLPPLIIPIIVLNNNTYIQTTMTINTNRVEITPPTGGWNSAGYNFIFINTHFFRDSGIY